MDGGSSDFVQTCANVFVRWVERLEREGGKRSTDREDVSNEKCSEKIASKSCVKFGDFSMQVPFECTYVSGT